MLRVNRNNPGRDARVKVRSMQQLIDALATTQEQSAKHYRAVLRWMAYAKVKHDALALAWKAINYSWDVYEACDVAFSAAEHRQIEAALNQHLEVEGEEQWFARTIMLTEALDQYLKVMEQDAPDPEQMQQAFLRLKERHFVFMPAELANKGE